MSTVASKSNRDAPVNRTNRTVLIILLLLVLLIAAIFLSYRNAAQAARDEYFMDGEIILVGTTTELDALIQELQTIDDNIILTIDPNRSFSLQDLGSPAEQTLGPQTVASAALQIGSGSAACSQLSSDLEINLYELTGSTDDVEAVLEAIDQTTAGSSVLADANWVIGAPWHPTGSPWHPTGSPWHPTGSDVDQGKPTPATMDDYLEQWAFSTIGLVDAQAVNTGSELARIRVGVFDTSPLESNGPAAASVQESPTQNALKVQIDHPEFINTPVPPEEGSRQDINVANHGYFGTSFIRQLAPASEIELIRVLTKNNRGDLATLNHELLTFMGQANQNGIMTVVNMSLGVPPLEPFRPFEPWLDWEFPPPFELVRQLNSLETVMQIGECLDVVMVAAAGNDSAESLKVSNYPGHWGTVLSVTASNQDNQQSCYANDGDLAAPGGDGGPSDPKAEEPIACEPKLHECVNLGPNCPYSVIGYVHPSTLQSTEAAVTHHNWVGTSFAAPMVTGLAALVRQLNPGLSAAEVRDVIQCGTVKPTTPQEVPVINVARTLACARDLNN
ncbi:MAG: S8/S53 family peptidase [Anaerolineaceae bacterium]|nr:S8/S53 family peptidase [Anaerolineaceae bacterium]